MSDAFGAILFIALIVFLLVGVNWIIRVGIHKATRQIGPQINRRYYSSEAERVRAEMRKDRPDTNSNKTDNP
jgi:hypothetical protein